MTRLGIALFAGLLLLSGCKDTRNASSASDIEGPQEDIYIPKDLNDSFVQLKKLLKPKDVEKMRRGAEDDMIQYHFGLGMWMRNNWGLWGGSRLANWFATQGINHPDDMSGIILDSFWRHLNDKPIKLEEQVKYYKDYWEKQKTIQPEHSGGKQ